MSELQVLRTALDGANALVISLIGRNRVEDSRENARRLCERMAREERDSLIMDYRRCALDHTVAQFSEVAAIFAENMPAGVRIAYVYAPENFMHAATMTKQLAKAGFPARAFNNFEAAAEHVRGDS
jgi:hypothetical protein